MVKEEKFEEDLEIESEDLGGLGAESKDEEFEEDVEDSFAEL